MNKPEQDATLLKRLYAAMLEKAKSPKAMRVLALVSFAESSFFPIPPDLMMIPMMLADRLKVWRIAFIATLSSVLGGFLGYAIGYGLYATIGQWVIRVYGLETAFMHFQEDFAHYGFWVIVLKGLTPIPYKLVTIASGLVHFNLLQFACASLITRAFRFYLVAALLWAFGPVAKRFIEKYLGLFLVLTFIALIAGYGVIKWSFS